MSAEPNCPLCPDNKLLEVPITAQNDAAYLIPARGSDTNYLIIPKEHIEDPAKLADDWWQDLKPLLDKVPGRGENYNISLNIGQVAGQRVPHLHFWIIPRQSDTPSSGKGLAILITEKDQG